MHRKRIQNTCPFESFVPTQDEIVIDCLEPVLTIGFPRNVCPGPNSVVLANGAVVDLVELGRILSQFCPAIVCQPDTFIDGTTVAPLI